MCEFGFPLRLGGCEGLMLSWNTVPITMISDTLLEKLASSGLDSFSFSDSFFSSVFDAVYDISERGILEFALNSTSGRRDELRSLYLSRIKSCATVVTRMFHVSW